MRILAITVALLALGCSDRLDELESRQNYIFEIIRQRTLSSEACAAYSDSRMTCVRDKPTKKCACTFTLDETDAENEILRAAIELRALQLKEEEVEIEVEENEEN
jgi:hypothetical protein